MAVFRVGLAHQGVQIVIYMESQMRGQSCADICLPGHLSKLGVQPSLCSHCSIQFKPGQFTAVILL